MKGLTYKTERNQLAAQRGTLEASLMRLVAASVAQRRSEDDDAKQRNEAELYEATEAAKALLLAQLGQTAFAGALAAAFRAASRRAA